VLGKRLSLEEVRTKGGKGDSKLELTGGTPYLFLFPLSYFLVDLGDSRVSFPRIVTAFVFQKGAEINMNSTSLLLAFGCPHASPPSDPNFPFLYFLSQYHSSYR